MGFAKHRMMAQEEHGYRLDEDAGSVCGKCGGDYALAEVVAGNATENQCDYCGAESENPIAADVEVVLDRMGSSIASEYDQAVDALSRDEGEYVGAATYDIEEVLADEGWDGHPKFRALVLDAFADGHYCRRDPYAIAEFEALQLGWREFRDTVIKEARFTFTLVPDLDDGEHGYPVLRGGAMLQNLGKLIAEHGLYRELRAGESWLRARPVKKRTADYMTAKDLGAPPSYKAQPNRMSPAGIPMFYASKNEQTSIEEALGASSREGADRDAMVARFETTREGLVVDLTDIPPTPSLFDEARRAERPQLGFLHGFERDVSAPLRPEDKQQTEYVPTQIVCEYLRHHWRTSDGRRPVGLMFRSARHRDTLNIVYFLGPEGCLEPGADADPAAFQVRLTESRRVMR